MRLRLNALAVAISVPGARPKPKSTLLGNKVANVPNCSAITSGEWLGNITPPEPILILDVAAAICPRTTAVAELATPYMP